MASADLVKDLECSICLNAFTDPVMLRCGHTFCRKCIDCALDKSQSFGGYSCPQCREKFTERPTLHRNIALSNIVESLMSTPPGQEMSGKVCSYCIHFPAPAVKYCLSCDASLCDNHLGIHNKSSEHILCDPNNSLEGRKCSKHNEILKYYCTRDDACICVSCSLFGEHRGHRVETLEVASEMKKEKLRNVLQVLKVKKRETEKRMQSLQDCQRKVQGQASAETTRVTAMFIDLRKQLEDLEKKVLSMISRHANRMSSSMADVKKQLELKKDEVYKKIRRIEELCGQTDPMTILQKSHTGDLCNPEVGERLDKPHHTGWDLDVAAISQFLNKGLLEITSGLNVQKCTETPAAKKAHIATAMPHTQPTGTAHPSHHQVVRPNTGVKQKTSMFLGATEIFLDVNTAHNNLEISENGRTASRKNTRCSHPNTPERFQYHSNVLSRECFYSGRSYWEVDVGGSNSWRVGMCYPSMDRKGPRSMIGDNNMSWGFHRHSNEYSVIHDSKEIRLPDNISSDRVRVCLDYEGGTISFYSLCDTVRHLHTYNATFTEPLHAVLGVWHGCVTICEGSSSSTFAP